MANKYTLITGEQGSDQLDNLDRWFGQASREFLLDIGLKPGLKVLDVGCGIGNLSRWMAEIVGPTGSVLGVDSDQQQILVANQRVEQEQIKNCQFEKANADDLNKYQEQYDLVYSRWLLIHVQNAKQVVEQMAKAVKSGGLLACETGDMFTSRYYPNFTPFDVICDKLNALLTKTGADVHIAQTVIPIFQALKNFDFNVKYSQGVVHGQENVNTYTYNFITLLDGVAAALEKFDILNRGELNQLKEAFQKYQATPGTHIALSRMTQVWAKK